MRRLPYLAFLVVVWVTLWGDLSVANVVTGVLVGGGLMLAFPSAGPGPMGIVRPLKALRFGLFFLYKLGEATLIVAWEIITPGENINQGVVAVPVLGASDAVLTLVANSVSLTPGTVTIDVRRRPATLYIHVLHLRSVEETRMDVLTLERLALDAFGSKEAIEAARRLRESVAHPETSPTGRTRSVPSDTERPVDGGDR
jgi:multicomponent Na+:H+ antiporter subunit E